MNEQIEAAKPKRGPGRPRKHPRADEQRADGQQPEAQKAYKLPSRAVPVEPLETLVTDRHGAGRILGVSWMTVKRIEAADPDFPRPFKVGAHCDNYLIADIHAWVLKKAREAQSA
ncbi:hypothetical protein [Paraburkholderia sp. BR14320]|uniref:hypothetical protein n=1 Tax=unclassified Paraburkholderia TaxID=2615204 RepID=UPI0034CFCBF8